MQTETKVGLFVVAAATAMGWLSYQSNGGASIGSEFPRTLSSDFSDVAGISEGTAVRVAGVKVGEVASIELRPNGVALVTMHVKDAEDLILPANVQAKISSDGIIGEKFISLGTDLAPEGLLPPELNSIPSGNGQGGSFDDVAGNFAKLSADLQDVSSALRGSLGGAENAERLERIMSNIDAMTSRFSTILGDVQNGQGTMGALLNDPTMANDLRQAIADFSAVAQKVNAGQGTLGRLVNDDSTVTKIEEALESLSGAAGRIDQFQTTVDMHGYQLFGEDAGKGRFSITLQPRPNRFYLLGVTGDGQAANSDDARNPTGILGQDFGKEVKFTLQFGQVFENVVAGKDIALRLGLYDSSFGVGTDVRFFDNRLQLSADLYDFDGRNSGSADGKAHLDLTARYFFDGGLYVMGGIDNAINAELSAPFLGAGYRFGDDDLKYLLGAAL